MGYYASMIILIPAIIFTMYAQAKVSSNFRRYSNIRNSRNMTGAEAARRMLDANGLGNVEIQQVRGSLTDHYDPRHKVLRLSDGVYGSNSIAAVGVAAHECGHAVQHAVHYKPLAIRSAIVPAANLGSQLSWPLFLAGLIFSFRPLLTAGIVLFCGALLFQVVTLPVEFNASGRALVLLEETGIMGREEVGSTRKVLQAAALTYVAAVVSSLLQLLRLLILSGAFRRRDDN